METRQLNNYKIGFYSNLISFEIAKSKLKLDWDSVEYDYDYAGLVSDISEELAERIVDTQHSLNTAK